MLGRQDLNVEHARKDGVKSMDAQLMTFVTIALIFLLLPYLNLVLSLVELASFRPRVWYRVWISVAIVSMVLYAYAIGFDNEPAKTWEEDTIKSFPIRFDLIVLGSLAAFVNIVFVLVSLYRRTKQANRSTQPDLPS